GFGYRGAGFGYRVGGVSRPCTNTPITINEHLLQSLSLELDPNMQIVKYQAKEQIKPLNNKFAPFIYKVEFLEQQSKMLETKLSFLQGQNHCKSTLMPIIEAYIDNSKKQLEALECNKAQSETDLKAEQQLKNFLLLLSPLCLQDVDCFFLNKADLEAKMESLNKEAEFLRMFYEEEIQQLQAQISETLVVVQMDNSQDLDLDDIAADVKAQNEDIARRSQAEVQAWCKSKFEDLQITAGRNAASLQETKKKGAELTQIVQRLNREVRSAKNQ
ncbi:KRT81 protein, partial [Todus mexicanus]|nr:KRT81 protein [Todus mexicanus]